jgi:hypothetical protein
MRPRTLVGADARSILVMKAMLPTRGLDAVWSRGIEVESRDLELDGCATGRADAEPASPRGSVRRN